MSELRTQNGNRTVNRRDFMKKTAIVGATAALTAANIPHVFAAEDNTIRLALIGCGGRGAGAAVNALSTPHGPTKLVAMADVFEDRVKGVYANIKESHKDAVDVTQDRMFVGFDGYARAMDCLRPGDVAIMTTPPAFRWVHFKYAIEKGLHTFMEKPITVDGPSTRRMLK